jgi:gas vesicle protein
MGLFDKIKDKADGLVQDAKDKVTDVTGVDADKLLDAADAISDTSEKLSDAAESWRSNQSER